jgi:hypothetical protein
MSFTSTFPTGLVKLLTVPAVRVIYTSDAAAGMEAVPSRLVGALDRSVGREVHAVGLTASDEGSGVDVLQTRFLSHIDTSTGLDSSLPITVPELLFESFSNCVDSLRYVFYKTPVEARDVNTKAACLKLAREMLDKYRYKLRMPAERVDPLVDQLDSIISMIRYVKSGDIILPEDHNYVVDALKKARDIVSEMESWCTGLKEQLDDCKTKLEDCEKNLQAIRAVLALPSLLLFDYIVEIYPDKIVVTANDGTKTTLSTIAELNDWLKSVRGKRIVVYSYTEVNDEIVLTGNKYVFFRGRYYWIRIAEPVELYFLGDYVETIYNYVEGAHRLLSNSTIVVTNAELIFFDYAEDEEGNIVYHENVILVASNCGVVEVYGFRGGTVTTNSVVRTSIIDSELDFLAAETGELGLYEVTIHYVLYLRANNVRYIVANFTGFYADVDLTIRKHATLEPKGSRYDSIDFSLPLPNLGIPLIMEVGVYVPRASRRIDNTLISYIEPARDEVSYTVNLDAGTVTVTNNTSSRIFVIVIIRIRGRL